MVEVRSHPELLHLLRAQLELLLLVPLLLHVELLRLLRLLLRSLHLSPRLHVELMPLLHALLAPTGGRKRRRLLLAHKARHAALDAALIRRLGEIRGVSVREISSEAHHPEYRSAKIKIFDVGGVERAEAVLGLHDTNS